MHGTARHSRWHPHQAENLEGIRTFLHNNPKSLYDCTSSMLLFFQMEAVAAFALAGTVVTFVDFSSKLISGARELYTSTSGTLTVNEELELAISDLRSVLLKIQSSIETTNGQPRTSPQTLSEKEFDKSFGKICQRAISIAEEILSRLEKLKLDENAKGVRRVWGSLSHVVKSVWSSNELAALETKLLNLKDSINTEMMADLRKNFSLLSIQLSERFKELDRKTQYIVSALARLDPNLKDVEKNHQTTALVQMLARAEMSNSQEHHRTREMIASTRNREVISSIDVLDVPHEKESVIRKSVSNGILEHLNFDTRTHRVEEVPEARQKTFEWLFDESSNDEKKWDGFPKWLQEDNGLYWIQGKAGSGKSTLMRFIFEDIRTRQYLSNWASKSVPLYIGSFFFWLSGTREQKSQQGLLRSLLFEILNQEPNLVPIVFPLLWAERYTLTLSVKPGLITTAWSLKTLKEAFRILINQSTIPMKLFLLIDGLDELDADENHGEISELFKGIISSDVKVCVSSRPWVVFEESFQSLPFLRLQDLTRPDIRLVVNEILSTNPSFQRLALSHPLETKDFVLEIVNKADGVFLWVKLVVRALLRRIQNRGSISDLQLRLRGLPKELEPLYHHLLGLIEPYDLSWASKAFQILRAAQEFPASPFWSDTPIRLESGTQIQSLLGLHLAVHDEVDVSSVESWTEETAIYRCEDTKVHLTARCAGLLETWDLESSGPYSQVQFLHTTARDYIHIPSIWESLVRHVPDKSFSPVVSMIRAYVLQIVLETVLDPTISSPSKARPSNMAFMAIAYATEAEKSPVKIPPELLDSLETAMLKVRENPITKSTSFHWTQMITRGQGLPDINTFLPTAAMFGLTSYIASKPLEARKALVDGASLLHYAIPRNWTAEYIAVPEVTTIELLLETCDVNLVYDSKTPWQQLLGYVGQLFDGRYINNPDKHHVRILILMLQAGADRQVNVVWSYYHEEGKVYDVRSLAIDLRDYVGYAGCSEEMERNLLELEKEIAKPQKIKNPRVFGTGSERQDELRQSKTRRLKHWLKW